eukprot:CAMPEP_0119482254 /NCGR_PEP_ID=MMETSP1344-20130328/10189_1 /TAXON_ID=236787 /ORGANISM="Florenciella parvula, Strain CCMP2471" /LENGTH=808 /DNA_ID=CAMNT_0007516639 /DNA_START=65 /DNA_END=2491 /DNA_ORIENTATION=+
MRGLLAVAALAAGAHGLELFADDPSVVVVDKKGINSKVLKTTAPVMLGVFSDNAEECEHCALIAAEFSKAAKKLASYGVQSAAFDCTDAWPRCHSMTSPLQITNLPAIKAFTAPFTVNPYTKKPHRDQAPYEGAANARSMQKHVLAQIPDTLIERQTGESFPPSTEGGSALVLLFTDRDSSSPLYKSLANSFAGRLTFAEVHSSEEGLTAQYAIDKFPTMLVTLVDHDVDKGYVYKGDLKSWAEMSGFLETYALPPAETDDDSAGEGASEDGTGTGAEDGKKKKKKKGPEGPPTLTEDDFGATVLKSQNAWMVLFRDGEAGEEAGDGDEGDGVVPDDWAKVASKADGLISAGEVDCKVSAKLCDSGVALPYIKVYGFGLDEKDDIMAIERFKGDQAARALQEASDSLPDATLKLNAMTTDHAMSASAQEGRLLLILLSNKSEPPTMLKSLALAMEDQVAVGFYPNPDPQTMQRFQVPRLPMFVSMFASEAMPGDEDLPPGTPPGAMQIGIKPFDPLMFGRPTFESVFAFSFNMVAQLFPENADAMLSGEVGTRLRNAQGGAAGDEGGEGGGSAGAGKKKAGAPKAIVEISAANWEEVCPPSSSTLCAIGFLSGGEESPTFEDELAVVKASAAAHTSDPYVFAWVDGSCLLGFGEAFDVQPMGLPTMVAYSPKKQRFAGFVGVFGIESVNDLLNGVLSGRVKTKPVYQAPVVDDVDCKAVAAERAAAGEGGGDVAVEEEEDMGDFMAEILAEEKAAKKALEEEMKREAEEKKAQEKADKEAAKAAAKEAEGGKKKKSKKKKKKKKKSEL